MEQVVLKQVMLRCQKDQILNRKALIELPKRTVNVVSCDFDPSVQNFYDSLETKMKTVIEKLMATSKMTTMMNGHWPPTPQQPP